MVGDITRSVSVVNPMHNAHQLFGPAESEDNPTVRLSTFSEIIRHVANVSLNQVTKVLELCESPIHNVIPIIGAFESDDVKDMVHSDKGFGHFLRYSSLVLESVGLHVLQDHRGDQSLMAARYANDVQEDAFSSSLPCGLGAPVNRR